MAGCNVNITCTIRLVFIYKNDVIRSDEGLTLETSAFQIFHGGNFTFINSFDKNQIFVLISPTDAAPQFL